MKLLIDESLSQRLVRQLTMIGHDAVHISDRGLNGHADHEVMKLALEEDRVVISADTGFGEQLPRPYALFPSIVLLRLHVHDPEEQAAVIDHALDLMSSEIKAGTTVLITDAYLQNMLTDEIDDLFIVAFTDHRRRFHLLPRANLKRRSDR